MKRVGWCLLFVLLLTGFGSEMPPDGAADAAVFDFLVEVFADYRFDPVVRRGDVGTRHFYLAQFHRLVWDETYLYRCCNWSGGDGGRDDGVLLSSVLDFVWYGWSLANHNHFMFFDMTGNGSYDLFLTFGSHVHMISYDRETDRFILQRYFSGGRVHGIFGTGLTGGVQSNLPFSIGYHLWDTQMRLQVSVKVLFVEQAGELYYYLALPIYYNGQAALYMPDLVRQRAVYAPRWFGQPYYYWFRVSFDELYAITGFSGVQQSAGAPGLRDVVYTTYAALFGVLYPEETDTEATLANIINRATDRTGITLMRTMQVLSRAATRLHNNAPHNRRYDAAIMANGLIHGQGQGYQQHWRIGWFGTGAGHACGPIAVYNAFYQVAGLTQYPSALIRQFEQRGGVNFNLGLLGTNPIVLYDLLRPHFRSRLSFLPLLSNISLNQAARKNSAVIILYQGPNFVHFVMATYQNNTFRIYNEFAQDQAAREYASLDEWARRYRVLALITVKR